MSSLDRPLAGDILHFHLSGDGGAQLVDADLLARAGRSARTLVKDGPLRVTLVALAAGGELTEHRADGPITVHVVSGRVRFVIDQEAWSLESGDLLSVPAGVSHSVESEEGGQFLLTVALASG